MNDAKQNILNRIRNVNTSPDADFVLPNDIQHVYQEILDRDTLSVFVSEAEMVGAQVVLVADELELIAKIKKIAETRGEVIYSADSTLVDFFKNSDVNIELLTSDLTGVSIGLTNSECLVARTGSVLLSSITGPGRRMNVFPPTHLVVANVQTLVHFPEDAIAYVQNKYKNRLPSQISFVTGPSRTADIEKTLVMGAHGPKELIIFVKNYRNAE